MTDAPDPPEPVNPGDPNDIKAIEKRAAASQRDGLRALEAGDFVQATRFLIEAVGAYEKLGRAADTNAAAHYLGLALAGQGQSEQALQIWEEIVDRGWDSPAAFNCLIRHYEAQGDQAQVERLYGRLRQAATERTGEFFRHLSGPEAAAPNAGEEGRMPRVLVADDEDSIAQLLERLIQPLGCEVVVAADGREALEAILGAPIDLVLIDIFMPVHSGLDVLYRMRAQGLRAPVIVMSGRADETMVQDALRLGASFLPKPFQREQVVALVNEALGLGT